MFCAGKHMKSVWDDPIMRPPKECNLLFGMANLQCDSGLRDGHRRHPVESLLRVYARVCRRGTRRSAEEYRQRERLDVHGSVGTPSILEGGLYSYPPPRMKLMNIMNMVPIVNPWKFTLESVGRTGNFHG